MFPPLDLWTTNLIQCYPNWKSCCTSILEKDFNYNYHEKWMMRKEKHEIRNITLNMYWKWTTATDLIFQRTINPCYFKLKFILHDVDWNRQLKQNKKDAGEIYENHSQETNQHKTFLKDEVVPSLKHEIFCLSKGNKNVPIDNRVSSVLLPALSWGTWCPAGSPRMYILLGSPHHLYI